MSSPTVTGSRPAPPRSISGATKRLEEEQHHMNLLAAQLKNQDPLNPMD